MKVVVYHADASIAKKFPEKTYFKLFQGFRKNLKEFNIPLVHITIKGCEGWGDENIFFDGDPEDIIWNREKFFLDFLKMCDDDIYWFAEPDSRLSNIFPPLKGDLALLKRHDQVPITPSWRLATKKSIPFFEEVFSYYDLNQKTWNSDGYAYTEIWKKMGEPNIGFVSYNGMNIELRDYEEYSRKNSQYTQQWKSKNKLNLILDEYQI